MWGFFDRGAPDGRLWKACRNIDEVIARLIEVESAMTDPSASLVAWGLDPIYFAGERLLAKHLDRVSQSRPIFVFHASAHLATVNSALMEKAGIAEQTTTPGVARCDDGRPNGELQEPPGNASGQSRVSNNRRSYHLARSEMELRV